MASEPASTDSTGESAQADVLAFLGEPASYAALMRPPQRVERVETHGAVVFLAGEEAFKVKRAVKLAYLDFSTLEARRRLSEREVEINRPSAPDIYLGTIAVTREPDGRLELGGEGEAVEWAVRMARFPERDVLIEVAARGGIDVGTARALGDAVAAMHAAAPVAAAGSGAAIEEVIASIHDTLARSGEAVLVALAEELAAGFDRQAARSDEVRRRRAAAGFVRRCHGDLHLGNIVLWQGRPVPFDAIEFDERIATIDTLYDLAFLLMDLERQGCRNAANAVLNRYLEHSRAALDLEGLAALPLFLGVRAGVRAMVAIDRLRVKPADERPEIVAKATTTLELAAQLLEPPPARLIAVGGLSGTGKSTLAAALAPGIGAFPGAVHLRSDVERKRLAGVAQTERLPAEAYTAAASAQVYDVLAERARLALAAGHSVVVDAVFAREAERDCIARVAQRLGAAFDGVWLEGRAEELKSRVAARRGDASDATPAVVETQLGYDIGRLDWHRVDAGGSPGDTRARAAAALRLTAETPACG